MEMESFCGRIPSYGELLERFGAEGLHRVRIVMRWLREAKGVESDPLAREEDSERRRIEAILKSVPQNSLAGRTLLAYREHLMSRVKV